MRELLAKASAFVVLVLLTNFAVFVSMADDECERVQRTVYALVDIPARGVWWALEPWTDPRPVVQGMYTWRLPLANFVAKQFYRVNGGYVQMCYGNQKGEQ